LESQRLLPVDYLVDANVLSETTKPRPAPLVVEWLRRHEQSLVVNPIILGELESGILLLPASRRRTWLDEWFADSVKGLPVLDLDADTATAWAGLLAELKRKGRAMPIKDSLIAATARQHRLTVATRNVDDYRYAGVALVNPFEPTP
jgi:toxin FitB